MRNLIRLKSRKDFLRISASGCSVATKGVVIQQAYAPESLLLKQDIRIGYTASRKVGKAVLRNRAKRRLRVLAQRYIPDLGIGGCDYVLIARYTTPYRRWDELCKDMRLGLRQLQNRKPDGNE